MATKTNKPIDITKTGPQGYRQLQQANDEALSGLSPEFQNFSMGVGARTAPTSLYDARNHAETQVQTSLGNWGESTYDNPTATEEEMQHLGDIRAENQPWYAQVGAGLAKGVVLAGTTFLDGTVGLVVGAGTAINEGRWSGLWDNDFSKAMQSVNEWAEEAMPNYYTEEEQNAPWYENIFTANFLGDKFIKNLGFTVGAFYSGAAWTKPLTLGGKLATTIGAVTKASKAPAMVNTAVGATISAVNEGRIEALNNSKDWYENQKMQIDDIFRDRIQSIQDKYEATKGQSMVSTPEGGMYDPAYAEYQNALSVERKNYEETLAKLNEDRKKMGNADLLMNLPILMASNVIQFGKLYANGYKTARKATNIVGKAGEYTAQGTSKLGRAVTVGKGALSEGMEEISQGAASRISGNYYATDVDNFYKSKTDPEAAQETLSWTKAFAQGINETVNDGSSWEEFFIGSLTGALGMPKFRSTRAQDGSFQSPITIEGGAINEWREESARVAREQEIADYMNNRVNSPEFKNYYQGLIRHQKYQQDMNEAAEVGDEFEFKNAEHAQLVSDIAMFDNAGKLNDLKTLINSAFDTSDENLESIIKNTTTQTEDGKLVGPFAQYAQLDNGEIVANVSDEDKQDLIDQITENKDEMMQTINDYQKFKDDIDIKTGQQLSDEQLEELTWIRSQIEDWNKRADTITGELRPVFSSLVGSLTSARDMFDNLAKEEGMRATDVTPLYEAFTKNKTRAIKNLQSMEQLLSYNNRTLAAVLANEENAEFIKGLKETVENDPFISADEAQDFNQKLDDVVKLVQATHTYNTKLKEYLENPEKQVEAHRKADEQAAQQETEQKTTTLRDKLSGITDMQAFRSAVQDETDPDIVANTLQSMEQDGNEMAKNYRETHEYYNNVRQAIDQSDADEQTKSDALKLLRDQYNNSANLQQVANPNSVFVNNDSAFDEDSEGDVELSTNRFHNAQYALQKAMNVVNNDNRFKDRFSPEYKAPVNAPLADTTRGTDREASGTEGGSTVPAVNTNQAEPTPVAVGNITSDMVLEENKASNDRVDTPTNLDNRQEGTRPYYRPSIPELHIEASKQGDFRPFNSVVAEREGKNFDAIYNYLAGQNAFNFVNSGNLKAGDEVGFMIDPEYEAQVEGQSWHTAPTVFMVTKSGQVIGSLDESQYAMDRYQGLTGLEERVRKEYQDFTQSNTPDLESLKAQTLKSFWTNSDNFEDPTDKKIAANFDALYPLYNEYKEGKITKEEFDQRAGGAKERVMPFFDRYTKAQQDYVEAKSKPRPTGRFIATPRTKVAQVMVGRVPYSTTEQSLQAIPNVRTETRQPVFGIIKNGTLSTNGKVDDSQIIKPVDMSQKEGRMYLLIPNASGKYSPAAVRVKHFNAEEFNLNDEAVATSPLGKNLSADIDKLASATNEDELNEAVKALKGELYIGDLHIDWFSSDAGNGIRITKTERDADGREIYIEENGQRKRKEDTKTVFLTEKWDKNTVFSITGSSEVQTEPDAKSTEEVAKEIRDILMGFNLPLQVRLDMLNKSGYNNMLVNSDILTSNISEATTRSSWFTTDYFDNEGNLHPAVSPASVTPQPNRKVETPVGGSEGAISGTGVTVNGTQYYVDTKTNTIRDNQGKPISVGNTELLLELAWAQENFGNATESSVMTDNKVITPSNKVLDRTTQQYLSGNAAQSVRDILSGKAQEREAALARSRQTIDKIMQNQERVDKTKTDGEYYYIMEEDGQYHSYDRVHSRLGSNWVQSQKQTEALAQIRTNLSRQADDVNSYNNYLTSLENHWKVNLAEYRGKVDGRSRDAIVNVIRDSMNGTNSQRALNAGTAVDQVIRDFFTISDVSKLTKPDNMSEQAYIDLLTRLNEIKSRITQMGETFLANNIVVFNKYADGTRVAGELDILAVDKQGNFKIYDVKTSKYSFYPFEDRNHRMQDYFNNKSNTQRMSTKDYYTLQLSAYKNLFESQYGVPIIGLGVMPYVLTYQGDKVVGITGEKGISITYNPSVPVPLASAVHAPVVEEHKSDPVFNASLETQNPIEDMSKESEMEGSTVGYYIKDGKMHKGYMLPLTPISGVNLYMIKEPNITSGFGRATETAHVASNNFYVVFPNGNTIRVINNGSLTTTDAEAKTLVENALKGNPNRVVEQSKVETEISRFTTTVTPSARQQAAQIEQVIGAHDEEFEDDDIDIGSLRQVDNENAPLWNQEQELAWISKVLPQLSNEDRVKVVKGLIPVARSGAKAWGMFNDGIVTLSDVAAEGTTYHEAFHAVFQLLLEPNERVALLSEAKQLYGDKSDSELEEAMAEDFREYVQVRENPSLLQRIKNFFEDLVTKVTNWNRVQPHMTAYFQMVNNGRYANKPLNIQPLATKKSSTTFAGYSEEVREALVKKGWTEEFFNSVSQDEREQALNCLGF